MRAVLIALVLAGCTVGSDEPTSTGPDAGVTADDSDEAPPPIQLEPYTTNRVKTAFEFFRNKGLTRVQAAGIVGNLMQESSVSPTAVQYGGGPGRGIAQWSVGGRWNASYHDNVAWYAAAHGLSRWSLTAQLDFIWFELTQHGYGFSQLKAATTVYGAVKAFQDRYEICGACDMSNRIRDADYVLAHY
jgi:hypothetical protein